MNDIQTQKLETFFPNIQAANFNLYEDISRYKKLILSIYLEFLQQNSLNQLKQSNSYEFYKFVIEFN